MRYAVRKWTYCQYVCSTSSKTTKLTCSCFLPFVGHCSWSSLKVSSVGPGQTSIPGLRSFMHDFCNLLVFQFSRLLWAELELKFRIKNHFSFNCTYFASASWSFKMVKLLVLNFRVCRKSSFVYENIFTAGHAISVSNLPSFIEFRLWS